jgi:hypothetical protein
MAKPALQYCNNCGRRIQSHQSKLEIRVRNGTDTYHETWKGCYESTRESGKYVSTKLEEDLVKITPIY